MHPKVSIVVPVYNVESYLKYSVQSMRNQSLKEIEIILVNDGSTDSSGSICDDFALQDNRIKVIHKKNGGVSSARNQGLTNIRGRYVAFVDSDDIISKVLCERLYTAAITTGADMVMSEYKYVSEGFVEEHSAYENNHKTELFDRYKAFYKITSFSYKSGTNVCTKLFKNEIAQSFRFSEGVSLGEDQEYVFLCLTRCKKVLFIAESLYYYRHRPGSAMNQPLNVAAEQKLRDTYTRIQAIAEWNELPKYKNRLLTYRLGACEITILNKMIYDNIWDDTFAKEICFYMRKNLRGMVNADFPIWKKVQIGIAAISVSLYKRIMLLKHRYKIL